MRAYIAAGRPQQDMKPYGGFEEWSAMVRAPLVWLGCDDPCVSRDEVEDTDPDTEKLANLLDALPDRFLGEFTVAQAVQTARKDALNTAAYGGGHTPLYDALAAICWEGKINPTGVGKAFAKYRGRIVKGRKLTRVGVRHQAIVWKVEVI
jgi:putative DNA primase/helicase